MVNALLKYSECCTLDEESIHFNLFKIVKGSSTFTFTRKLFDISTKPERRMIFENDIVSGTNRWRDNKRNRINILFKKTRYTSPRPIRNLKMIRTNRMLMTGIDDKRGNDNMDTNNIKNKIYNFAKLQVLNKFHTSTRLNLNKESMIRFLKWLSKYDKKWKTRVRRYSKHEYEFRTVDYFIVVDANTIVRIRTGDSVKSALNTYDILNGGAFISYKTILVDIYGKQCFTLLKLFDSLTSFKEYIGCYTTSYSSNRTDTNVEVYYKSLSTRSRETVFINKDINDRLFTHINRFLSNKNKYQSRDLLYKTGILLYGEPGTGKSTISRMICTEYHLDMIIIDMSNFCKMNIDYITNSINADGEMYILVLEDIDRVMDNIETDKYEAVNKLLQFLDSSSSPTNVIFIATTNHLDRLDPAITRDGRFDLVLNVGSINKEPAIDMIKSFDVNESDAEELWNKNNVNGTINPAKLQNIILQFQGEKELELQED